MSTKAELQSYHSPLYLSFLEAHNDCQDHEDIESSSLIELEQLGLGEPLVKLAASSLLYRAVCVGSGIDYAVMSCVVGKIILKLIGNTCSQ